MTVYQRKVLDAWKAVSDRNGGKGASAGEVVVEMADRGTLAAMDTVIDIADIMKQLRGDFFAGPEAL